MITPITRERIRNFFFDECKLDVYDVAKMSYIETAELYSLPDLTFIENEFSSRFYTFSQDLVGRYQDGKANCTLFSEAGRFFARISHRISEESDQFKSGIAFGIFNYKPEKVDVAHSINFFIHRLFNLDRLYIKFYEPQTCQLKTLTSKEIQSCFGIFI